MIDHVYNLLRQPPTRRAQALSQTRFTESIRENTRVERVHSSLGLFGKLPGRGLTLTSPLGSEKCDDRAPVDNSRDRMRISSHAHNPLEERKNPLTDVFNDIVVTSFQTAVQLLSE